MQDDRRRVRSLQMQMINTVKRRECVADVIYPQGMCSAHQKFWSSNYQCTKRAAKSLTPLSLQQQPASRYSHNLHSLLPASLVLLCSMLQHDDIHSHGKCCVVGHSATGLAAPENKSKAVQAFITNTGSSRKAPNSYAPWLFQSSTATHVSMGSRIAHYRCPQRCLWVANFTV